MYAMTAAHKTLPLGTQIVVINRRDRPAHPGAGERPGAVRRGPHRRPLPGGGAGARVGRGGRRARDPRGRPAGLGLRGRRRRERPGGRTGQHAPAPGRPPPAARCPRRRCEARSRSRSAPSRSRATPARSRRACRCRRSSRVLASRTTAPVARGDRGDTEWRVRRGGRLRGAGSPGFVVSGISPASGGPGRRGRWPCSASTVRGWRLLKRVQVQGALRLTEASWPPQGTEEYNAADGPFSARRRPGWRGRRGASAAVRPRGR